MKTSKNVLAHRSLAEHYFPYSEEDVATILALIHIESAGDAAAISPSGSFYGLLQIGAAYLADACDYARVPRFHPRELLGDAEKSIWVVEKYMTRYSRWHLYKPEYMALAHKAGAGTLRAVFERKRDIDEVSEWNTPEYMRRFRLCYPAYLAEITKGTCA